MASFTTTVPKRLHLLTFNGKTQTLSAWAEEMGISKQTLSARILNSGWSVEKALTTPVGRSPQPPRPYQRKGRHHGPRFRKVYEGDRA